MLQNGGDFSAGNTEDGVIVSSGVETCMLCYGDGATADIGVAHDLDNFDYN